MKRRSSRPHKGMLTRVSKTDYTWPVANAIGKLEEMKGRIKEGDRNDPPATEHDRKELMGICMDYAIGVVEGIARNDAMYHLPTYQESFYHLTKIWREAASDALERTAWWLKELGTNYRFERYDDE